MVRSCSEKSKQTARKIQMMVALNADTAFTAAGADISAAATKLNQVE